MILIRLSFALKKEEEVIGERTFLIRGKKSRRMWIIYSQLLENKKKLLPKRWQSAYHSINKKNKYTQMKTKNSTKPLIFKIENQPRKKTKQMETQLLIVPNQ
uniref:(northern house mosquito) hypothetical protein n=1 Tax=Culex pipiens TaxID=7175 RepID=A0A8D8IFV8_CULPI